MSIRKALGATVPSVVKLISLELPRLVILANILAWSLVYFVVHAWLQNFAYRIRPGLETFVVGGILALGNVSRSARHPISRPLSF